MTDPTADRRSELMAAALAGELTQTEAADFDRMRADDPTIDAELAELGGIVGRISALPDWVEAAPSDDLQARIAGIGAGEAGEESPAPVIPSAPAPATAAPAPVPTTRPRRPARIGRWLPIGVAAACLVVGAIGGFLLPRPETPPPVGAPGTLGAVEAVDFQGEPTGVDIDGSVVAHTWGTETLLSVRGLPAGAFYSVVVVDEAGQDIGSGTFLGSAVEIDCAVNAATLREAVSAVEIRAQDGHVVAAAELPAVSS